MKYDVNIQLYKYTLLRVLNKMRCIRIQVNKYTQQGSKSSNLMELLILEDLIWWKYQNFIDFMAPSQLHCLSN